MVAYKTAGRWRDHLTIDEAKEVVDLEAMINGIKAALGVAMARRDTIQKRSHARYVWRRDHPDAVRKPLSVPLEAPSEVRVIHPSDKPYGPSRPLWGGD